MGDTSIAVTELWTGDFDDRLPIDQVDAGEHIHARLEIVVGGHKLPWLGFFGDDDVCLNTWVEQLVRIKELLVVDGGWYEFDEGEQAQPAFVFERKGDEVVVSVRPSRYDRDAADREATWRASGAADEFLAAVDAVLHLIRTKVVAVGAQGERWWAAIFPRFNA